MKTGQKIINWIKRQVKSSGAKGVVMGLSGGVDSSLAAVLVRKAVGRKRLLCLLLPCHNSEKDLYDSQLIVRNFKLRHKTIDIRPLYNYLCRILPPADKKATGNLKSRLRMLVIYYFANKLNYLVAGTSNKSELMIGYFTKYGDGGADILPIGGLLKNEVRKLAKEMAIPAQIINKPPSAGLWADQTDESEMGISYQELDDILHRLESHQSQRVSKQKVSQVKGMIKASEHKRRLAVVFKSVMHRQMS